MKLSKFTSALKNIKLYYVIFLNHLTNLEIIMIYSYF